MLFVKLSIVLVGMVLPVAALACENTSRQKCKEQLGELISYRAEAIERAFGDLIKVMPAKISVKFVGPHDAEYKKYARRVAYDPSQESLIVPRHYIAARFPRPLRASAYYWPFYENDLYRKTFPLITAVDNALWGAYLQEAAKARGLTWPHANCLAEDITTRLPCEMLVAGVAEHLTAVRNPMFNTNRIDRIWPQDFASFRARVWRRDDPRYADVLRYGGLMLIKPLIDEFGVPSVLYYLAQTPFEIENDNVRASALKYQDRAREWLEAYQGQREGPGVTSIVALPSIDDRS